MKQNQNYPPMNRYPVHEYLLKAIDEHVWPYRRMIICVRSGDPTALYSHPDDTFTITPPSTWELVR